MTDGPEPPLLPSPRLLPAPPPPAEGVPPPPGWLVFDASFESGNVGETARVSELEWDIGIRPDTLNLRFRVWFYFSVSNMLAGQQALLNITGHSKTKSLFRDGMTPVLRSASRPQWERLPDKHVYYHRSPQHEGAYVLSVALRFDRAEAYQLAYCYPYTYSALQGQLRRLDTLGLPCYRRECLCRSLLGRRLDVLTISSPRNLALDACEPAERAGPGAPRPGCGPAQQVGRELPVVFVSARVHPGESPSSFMMHGLLNWALSDAPEASALRSRCVLKLVPMLCPDGVLLGNYRASALGLDLNRQWADPSGWASPTTRALKRLMERCAPALCLDLHAHSTASAGFLFCNAPAEPHDLEREAAFARALGSACPDFAFSSAKFCADPSKAGTGRRALSESLGGGCCCYTLEVSFFGRAAAQHGRPRAYSQADFCALGERIGAALHQHMCEQPPAQQHTQRQGAGGAGPARGTTPRADAPPRASTAGSGGGHWLLHAPDAPAAAAAVAGECSAQLALGPRAASAAGTRGRGSPVRGLAARSAAGARRLPASGAAHSSWAAGNAGDAGALVVGSALAASPEAVRGAAQRRGRGAGFLAPAGSASRSAAEVRGAAPSALEAQPRAGVLKGTLRRRAADD